MLKPQTQQKRLDSNYYIEGYAVVFNRPYLLYEKDGIKYYEVIDQYALSGADMTDVILLYDHTGKVLARKSNGTLLVEADEYGLFICADLGKSAAGKDLFEEISNGLITRMSWAFIVAQDEFDRNTRTRTIKKVKKVYDVSAVSIPANEDTEISARSYFNGVIEAERQELSERRKKLLKLKLELEEL